MNDKRPGLPFASGDYSTVPPTSPPSSAGVSTLGRYQIVRKLGQGGMGAVYLAFDPDLRRQVALKVMLPRFAADPDARARFLREARAAAGVKCERVVTIYDVGEARNIPYLAMELLAGQSLADRLDGLPLDQIVRIGRETAEGLAAAHALGLVHRDIKPANLWLEAPGERVKILDFGLARSLNDGDRLTQTGAIVGTPAFMSPEQAAGLPVDARSDLFSLGCVLYRLCTGRLPFEGDSTLAILTALATHPPAPVASVNPTVPAPLADLIHRLLAKKPEQRPESADAVASILREMETPSESVAPKDSRPQSEPSTTVAFLPKRKRLGLVLAALVLGLLVFAGLTAFAFRTRLPRDTGQPQPEPKDRPRIDLPPLDPAFAKTVNGLGSAKAQLVEIRKELIRRNPEFEGDVGQPGGVGYLWGLGLTSGKIRDLTPVLALSQLSRLAVVNKDEERGQLDDLRPLAGVKKLTELEIVNQSVSDLSPLQGKKLSLVAIPGNRVTDLSPLSGMPLLMLKCDGNPLSDLSPLSELSLSYLHVKGTNVRDLRPLRLMLMSHLGYLDIGDTKVTDLSPLAGSKLYALHAKGIPVEAAILSKLTLQEVSLDYDAAKHRTALKTMPMLRRINGQPVADFWKEVEKSVDK